MFFVEGAAVALEVGAGGAGGGGADTAAAGGGAGGGVRSRGGDLGRSYRSLERSRLSRR